VSQGDRLAAVKRGGLPVFPALEPPQGDANDYTTRPRWAILTDLFQRISGWVRLVPLEAGVGQAERDTEGRP
jgi:hypothetical protein